VKKIRMKKIKKACAAGSFYPADKEKLDKMVGALLKSTPVLFDKEGIEKISAAIVPHAGLVYSGGVAASVYKVIKNDWGDKLKRIILIGVSHQIGFEGVAVNMDDEWEIPFGNVEIASSVCKVLVKKDGFVDFSDAFLYEHSLEVQLPFLMKLFKGIKLVPLCCGAGVDTDSVSKEINKLLDDKTVVLISSDLSHYHPYETAKSLDEKTIDSILNFDYEGLSENEKEACGKEGILIGMKLAEMNDWQSGLVDYKNSGDVTGDKSAVVGYAGMIFQEK